MKLFKQKKNKIIGFPMIQVMNSRYLVDLVDGEIKTTEEYSEATRYTKKEAKRIKKELDKKNIQNLIIKRKTV